MSNQGFPPTEKDVEAAEERALLGERIASELGIGWIDLLPAFLRARDDGGDPLFIDLYHPTARGHDVAARTIAEALRDAGWLER